MVTPRRTPGLGIMLLSAQMLNLRIDRVPPVTLASIGAMVVLFLRVVSVPWTLSDVCLSARAVLDTWDIRRLTISTFEHADDMHLYYNMLSFLWKGITLENRFPKQWFALLLLMFAFFVNIVYIVLAVTVASILGDNSYLDQCAVGFSGVIFALKVLTTHYMPYGMTSVAGILIPRKWAVWVELVVIQLLVPNVSGLGHLAGILVGLAYVHGPLRILFNTIGRTNVPSVPDNKDMNKYVVCYYEEGPIHIPVRIDANPSAPSTGVSMRDQETQAGSTISSDIVSAPKEQQPDPQEPIFTFQPPRDVSPPNAGIEVLKFE